jgi:hypothetical protein
LHVYRWVAETGSSRRFGLKALLQIEEEWNGEEERGLEENNQ